MNQVDFSNFENQGNIKDDIKLNNTEETINFIIEESSKSIRSIKLFTANMQSDVYNNIEIRDAFLYFIKNNRHAKINILVEDLKATLNQGHLLMSLAQQLSSTFCIKDIPQDYHNSGIDYVLFDGKSFIYKPHSSTNHTLFSSCKFRSSMLEEFYDRIWQHAEQNVNTRNLRL